MSSDRAFTLIELIVVMAIIFVLLSILIPKLTGISERSRQASCMQNAKSLVAAIAQYASQVEGRISGISTGNNAPQFFGSLFQKDGWNNLPQLVCPSNKAGRTPLAAGYGNTLDMSGPGSTIDYWVVFAGNTSGGSLTPLEVYGDNTLIIESFSGTSFQSNHASGGIIGKINGSALFSGVVPKNKNLSGTTIDINPSDCVYS